MTKTPSSSHATRPTLTFDYEKYHPLLDDPSLSKNQKRQTQGP